MSVLAAVFLPLMLVAVGPAAAVTFPVDLTYTNLVGLPEGTITFGTVDTTSGGLGWTLDSFTSGGVTYTAVGFDQVCWDNGNQTSPQSTGGSLTQNCDGFGFFANEVDPVVFQNPKDVSTTDLNGGFAAHVKWNSGSSSCTGWIGSFAPRDQNGANDCLSAVPEPGTLALMGSALAGVIPLVGFRRKRARA